MSDSTGTATGAGGANGPDDGDDLDAVDAVPAGALAASAPSSSLPVAAKKQGRIRGIGTFYRQVVAELRKVIWPTRKELVTYTSVVLVFVTIMVAIVSVFDFAFGRAVLEVFGDSSL